MNYAKVILSGLAAIFFALAVILWPLFRGISEQKATGLGVFVRVTASPVLWILAVLFFVLFFAASRLGNKILRVLLFWIPTLTVSVLVMAIVALFTYVSIHFRDR
jgi:hypothetical protein